MNYFTNGAILTLICLNLILVSAFLSFDTNEFDALAIAILRSLGYTVAVVSDDQENELMTEPLKDAKLYCKLNY